jgi:Ca2+-binding RTX toxin-like protein
MYLFNRKALTAIGVAAAATTTLLAAPAQAATTGKAQVLGEHQSIVTFTAAAGKANSLVITISGRTITLNDQVAIKPGKGCKAVKGDKTKVKCTTARKPTELSVVLGNKNDRVVNNTGVPLVAEGGSGNDALTGGTNRDRLFGGSGNDYLAGRAGNDAIDGGTGNDHIYGGKHNDWLHGDTGKDTIHGQAGNDTIIGGPGKDALTGGAGKDKVTQ